MCFHTKFGGCNSKNKPATPLRSLKWSWAWHGYGYFSTSWGGSPREKITKNTITQKCFEISPPNFYQLKISSEVNFSQILMGIAWKMVLPRPWPFETSQGRGRLIFWATTSKFGEKTHLLMIFKWYEIMFLIPPLVSDLKKSGWAAPYISIACTWVNLWVFTIAYHRLNIQLPSWPLLSK